MMLAPARMSCDANVGWHQWGGACAAGAVTCSMGWCIRKQLLQRRRMTKTTYGWHFAQPHCHMLTCKGCAGTLLSHIATCVYENEDPCAATLATKGYS